jgi:outer membrane murein-binding lipoprotein Lpp
MTQIRFDGCDLSPRGARTPRFRQRTVAAVIAVAAAVLLVGCGGSDRLSKPEYEQKMNQAGRNLSAVFGTIDQRRANLSQLAVRVARARATLDRITGRLDAIKPPKDAADAHQELVDGLRATSAQLAELGQAARAGDAKGVEAARAKLNSADTAQKIVDAIQRLQQAGFAINEG